MQSALNEAKELDLNAKKAEVDAQLEAMRLENEARKLTLCRDVLSQEMSQVLSDHLPFCTSWCAFWRLSPFLLHLSARRQGFR